ncbi:MAG: hypothetical protein ACFFBD_22950 [Candidatus Hodarchaeota archaeon]
MNFSREMDSELCKSCKKRDQCNKCTGRAYEYFGSMSAPQPKCLLFPDYYGYDDDLAKPYLEILAKQGIPGLKM